MRIAQLIVWSLLTILSPCLLPAEGWGHLKGQVVIDGQPPRLEPVVKGRIPGFPEDIPDESLVFDQKSQGLANCFIYIKTRQEIPIHPCLQESKIKEAQFIANQFRFVPHAMVIRTDQKILFRNLDDSPHQIHTHPLKNAAWNLKVKENQAYQHLVHPLPELLPFQVKCDLSPWMSAYWFIVDHPYAVTTDQKGQFVINKLPAGQRTFRIWHERTGFLEQELEVFIKDGVTLDLNKIRIPAENFME